MGYNLFQRRERVDAPATEFAATVASMPPAPGDSLPAAVTETHVSLFDGTNAGLALTGKPVFSVQHHPEASPGPTDSLYLFERFAGLMDQAK